jgi:uncharacterized membrane protein
MATELIAIIMDAINAVFTGWGTSLLTLFNTLIYSTETGFTVFAEYALVMFGFGLGMGVVMLVLKKVF